MLARRNMIGWAEMTRAPLSSAWIAVVASIVAACGASNSGTGDVPAAGDDPRGGSGRGGLAVSGTVGALDAGEVQRSIDRAARRVDDCLETARKRQPYLGGEIGVHIVVDQNGRTASAALTRSTLGDHDTEDCIVSAFAGQQWPRPVGGETGLVDHTMSSSPGTTDPAEDWTADRLRQAMARDGGGFEDLQRKLADCMREAKLSGMRVTMYLDEDGIAQSVGVASEDGRGGDAAGCVDAMVKATSFPSPGDHLVKVSLGVE
jgi:hypothetical protein